MRIAEVVSAPASPWQNPFVERVIGSIRRECLNHVVIINESHLRRLLEAYILYYHRTRTSGSRKTPPIIAQRPRCRRAQSSRSRKSVVSITDMSGAPRNFVQQCYIQPVLYNASSALELRVPDLCMLKKRSANRRVLVRL
jgi:Integrase core domain